MRKIPWGGAVFLLALGVRLGHLFLVEEPLLYSDQYFYFFGALRIAEHPSPLSYVLGSEDWRLWGGRWTVAPLYYLFAAGVFEAFGRHLLPLQMVQCVLGALTAVAVAALGREAAGPGGTWAGVAYSFYWPAIEMCRRVLTENAHTALLVGGFALLVRGACRGNRRLVAGALLLGLSALARSVSAAFVPIAALWRLAAGGLGRWRESVRPAVLLVVGGLAAILPWTARNVFITGDPGAIETVGIVNLWMDNAYEGREIYRNEGFFLSKKPAEATRRAPAFIWKGLSRNPGAFVRKVARNFDHLLRPEGLHLLLSIELPQTPERRLAFLLLDDALLLVSVPLFLVFAIAGRPSPVRSLLILWVVYYAFMLVVVFHVEIRYRSALMPLAFAGAAGGAAVLAEATERRRAATRLALGLGALFLATVVAAYTPIAWRALAAARSLAPAEAALARGDVAGARSIASAAASRDPGAARPWLAYGRMLEWSGHAREAIEAYGRARMSRPNHWVPVLVLPRLLREAGRSEEAIAAVEEANSFSLRDDPWQALEVAWRELPPPRTDEILLARGDYGAVRGFHHPRGDHRWSARRAFLRLLPTRAAAEYEVTLEMGSPEPSPLEAPVVTVRMAGAPPTEVTLGRDLAPHGFRARPAPGEPLVVELESPTWNRVGERAELGACVSRMTVAPVR